MLVRSVDDLHHFQDMCAHTHAHLARTGDGTSWAWKSNTATARDKLSQSRVLTVHQLGQQNHHKLGEGAAM